MAATVENLSTLKPLVLGYSQPEVHLSWVRVWNYQACNDQAIIRGLDREDSLLAHRAIKQSIYDMVYSQSMRSAGSMLTPKIKDEKNEQRYT